MRRPEDLRGRTFAFGSPSSTSGSLYPALMLRRAGIDFWRDLGRSTYTGGHDATAAAVASGRVDGGGLERRILKRLTEKGTIERGRVRQIARSTPIEGYPWVVRAGVPARLREQIAQAFLSIRDPRLLDLLAAERYERVRASAYDEIEHGAREVGLIDAR